MGLLSGWAGWLLSPQKQMLLSREERRAVFEASRPFAVPT